MRIKPLQEFGATATTVSLKSAIQVDAIGAERAPEPEPVIEDAP